MNNEKQISSAEAFLVAKHFLTTLSSMIGWSNLNFIVSEFITKNGEVQFLKSPATWIDGVWKDWVGITEAIVGKDAKLTSVQAYIVMYDYIEHIVRINTSLQVEDLLSGLKNGLEAINDQQIQDLWQKSIQEVVDRNFENYEWFVDRKTIISSLDSFNAMILLLDQMYLKNKNLDLKKFVCGLQIYGIVQDIPEHTIKIWHYWLQALAVAVNSCQLVERTMSDESYRALSVFLELLQRDHILANMDGVIEQLRCNRVGDPEHFNMFLKWQDSIVALYNLYDQERKNIVTVNTKISIEQAVLMMQVFLSDKFIKTDVVKVINEHRNSLEIILRDQKKSCLYPDMITSLEAYQGMMLFCEQYLCLENMEPLRLKEDGKPSFVIILQWLKCVSGCRASVYEKNILKI